MAAIASLRSPDRAWPAGLPAAKVRGKGLVRRGRQTAAVSCVMSWLKAAIARRKAAIVNAVYAASNWFSERPTKSFLRRFIRV